MSDKEQNQRALKWLRNRLQRKYKISPKQTDMVLGAIADLRWDWRNSKYDLWGLAIEDILSEMGAERCPQARRKDLT